MAKQHRPAVNARSFNNISGAGESSTVSYSGDKPNPELRKFVEDNAKPYAPEDEGLVITAFNQPITTTKATAIYNMHTYHQGKKPHDAIRQYIRHYTRPGDLVLDLLSGSGGTALGAASE